MVYSQSQQGDAVIARHKGRALQAGRKQTISMVDSTSQQGGAS